MRGLFITFEGPEGSGKSTQAARLAAALRACGRDVVTAREPGGTPAGEIIRNLLQHDAGGDTLCRESETLLFEASRAQLARTVIEPALERGAIVICDRFADSTTAYQGYGRGLDVEWLLALHAFAQGPTMPDLTLLIDVPVASGFARLADRMAGTQTVLDRMEREARDFHERVRGGYLALADRWPERIVRVDGMRDVDRVAADVLAHVTCCLADREVF
jgi:dTMP kinase